MSNTATIYPGSLAVRAYLQTDLPGTIPEHKPAVAAHGRLIQDIIKPETSKSHQPPIRPGISQAKNIPNRKGRLRYICLTGLAIGLFVFGLGFSLNTIIANHTAQSLAVKLISQANSANKGLPTVQTTKAPSTVTPSATAIANYNVAPTLPRYLNIPSLGVHARVLTLGVLSNGALAAPGDIYDAGWYKESSKPGEPGAMLIDGHVSSWTSHGVFYGINELKPGDSIQVVRGDGKVYDYQVVSSQTYSSNNFNMTKALSPIDTNKPGLNLITCTGDVISGTNEFNERIVVFAKQIN